MIKKPIKKKCKICGTEHYDNKSCIKNREQGNNLYNIVKKKKYIGQE